MLICFNFEKVRGHLLLSLTSLRITFTGDSYCMLFSFKFQNHVVQNVVCSDRQLPDSICFQFKNTSVISVHKHTYSHQRKGIIILGRICSRHMFHKMLLWACQCCSLQCIYCMPHTIEKKGLNSNLNTK